MTSLFGTDALPEVAHAGLVFERYGRFWNARGTETLKEEPLASALDTFVREYNQHGGARRELLDLVHARRRATPTTSHVEERTVETSARLAMGLGVDHPLKNGLTFDRVVGVPHLPATSLKGLCRAASQLLDENGADQRLRYLGSGDSWDSSTVAPRQRGAVCFLDAYPVQPPRLEVDVLTPHYKRYYDAIARNQTREGPVDWDAPNPVKFLTVAPRTRFLIRLLFASAAGEQQPALEWTWKYLREGLELLGLGAKTAVGYGLMTMKEPRPSGMPS